MKRESAYARRKKSKAKRLWLEASQLRHSRLLAWLRDADPIKRDTAAAMLSNRNSAAVMRDAFKLCRDQDPKVREQAAWILGYFSFPDSEEGSAAEREALALLRGLASGDPSARVRSRVHRTLEYRAAHEEHFKPGGTKAVSVHERRKSDKEYRLILEAAKLPHARLIAQLGAPDPMMRTVVVRELHVRNSKAALKDAVKLCRSREPIIRERAALVLGQLTFPDDDSGRNTGRKVTELLCDLALSDPGALVRAGALCALGHRASRGGDPALILKAAEKGARDRSSSVRYYAAFALGGINIPGAEAVLPRLLRDKDTAVRDWAAFVVFLREDEERIVYDTPEIRDALLDLASDPDDSVRFEAFRALGVLREKRAAPMLARELEAEDCIYFDLATAAGRIGNPVFIPILENALERYGDDDDIIKTALEELRSTRT